MDKPTRAPILRGEEETRSEERRRLEERQQVEEEETHVDDVRIKKYILKRGDIHMDKYGKTNKEYKMIFCMTVPPPPTPDCKVNKKKERGKAKLFIQAYEISKNVCGTKFTGSF